MEFPKLNPIVPVCDLRIRSKELENMGVRMSVLTENLKTMYGNRSFLSVESEESENQEESEDEEASYEVKEVPTPKKRVVKILDVNPKDNKSAETDSEDNKSAETDSEDNASEDPDYEEEIVKKKKRSIKREPVTATVTRKDKKNLSAYEQMIQKNREEKMAFLQSLKIEEAKLDLVKSVEEKKKKSIPVKRKYKEFSRQTSPPVLRKSKRLANIPAQDLSEDNLFFNSINKAGEESYTKRVYTKKSQGYSRIFKNKYGIGKTILKKVIPPMMTFKEALNDDDSYESYVTDLTIKESKCDSKFITYEKSDLKNLTVAESNIIKITPARITTLTWHPSPEQLIVAAGDKYGNLGLLNVSNESSPYLMRIHDGGVTNIQFSPFNHAQLISSSYDGILRCGDMVQHKFNEIYNVSDQTRCTYFDILTETTFIVAQSDGDVAVVDSRINGKSFEKKHACHDYSIKTVNIHPVNRNVFVSADNRGSIRIWDLRKLQKNPVAETDQTRAVHAAYFSPVTGNSILATSANDKISIFDCSDLTKIKLKQCMKHNNQTGRWLTVFRAMWLPYSEEAFVIGSMDYPRRVEVYDKNMFVYNIMHESFQTITSVNVFHPRRHALASGNSSGKLLVFT